MARLKRAIFSSRPVESELGCGDTPPPTMLGRRPSATSGRRARASSAKAAGDVKRLARDVGRVVRSEEGHRSGDLLNLADAAKRGDGLDPIAHVALVQA